MTRVLLRKCLQDAQWLFAGCWLSIFAFCWVRAWIVSRLDTDRFRAILDLLPDDWQRFTPVDFDWLITYAGRLSLAYDELIVVLCVAIWCITRGSDVVSGELGRGTMEMLLAQPLSRWQVLSVPSGVTLVGIALLAGAAWLGTWVGMQTTTVKESVRASWDLPVPLPWIGDKVPIPFAAERTVRTPMTDKVDATVFLPATVNLLALGLMVAGFTTLMSSWDRYRWRTIGIVTGVFIIQAIVKFVGLGIIELEWLLYCSALTPYEPEKFVQIADLRPELAWNLLIVPADGSGVELGPMGYHAIMAGIGLLCYIGATVIFLRRDLPAAV
jgi:ABC-2 type transport system permease protein